mmetsp:Transcript_20691/g.38767  ORF Transcript_20691/g.38767 Transcript_20691/m.38767 type:complete len:262 (+) Transcript_20691:42-827(+)
MRARAAPPSGHRSSAVPRGREAGRGSPRAWHSRRQLPGPRVDRVEEIRNARTGTEVVQRRAWQELRLQAAADTEVGHLFEIEHQGLILGHLGVMHHDPGLERSRRIDRDNQGVPVVGQLHRRAGGINAHHPNDGIQHGRVEAVSALGKHQRQRLMGRHRLRAEQRIAQAVEAVDQRDDARAGAHAVHVDALRESAAVGMFVVLGDDEQRCRSQAHGLRNGHALGDVLLIGLGLGRCEAFIAVAKPHGDFKFADVMQQRADA